MLLAIPAVRQVPGRGCLRHPWTIWRRCTRPWMTASGLRSSRRKVRGRGGRSALARSSKHLVQEAHLREELQGRILAVLVVPRVRRAFFTPSRVTRSYGSLTATPPAPAQRQEAREVPATGGRAAGSTAATRWCAPTLPGWWRSWRLCCRAPACECCRHRTWAQRPGTAAWQPAAGLALAGEGLAPPGVYWLPAVQLSFRGWRPACTQQLMRSFQQLERGPSVYARAPQ